MIFSIATMTTPTTEHEAENLRKLFGATNQRAFALKHGIPGGPAVVNQHLHGTTKISLLSGLLYAEAFNVPLHHISQRLALEAESLQRHMNRVLVAREQSPVYLLSHDTQPLAHSIRSLAHHLADIDQLARPAVGTLLQKLAEQPEQAETIVTMIESLANTPRQQTAA